MEILDKFLYTFFGKLDDAISFVETYIIRMTEWCWHTRVKLLKKRTVYIKITPKNLDKIKFNKLLKQKITPDKSIIKKCVQSKNSVRDLVKKLF